MAPRVVLFFPGYPEPGNADQLAHRFAHAICTGGVAPGPALTKAQVDAAPLDAISEASRHPGNLSEPVPVPGGEAQNFYAEVHQSILETSTILRAPQEFARRDPLVAHQPDLELGTLQVLFALFWRYSTERELRYAWQGQVHGLIAKHAGSDVLVVAHGLGSVAVYDALFKLGPGAPVEVLTIGSPLGLRVVQRRVKAKARPDAMYPVPPRVRRWTNVAAAGDPVSADPTLGDEYRWSADPKARVDDVTVQVDTGWPKHRWEGYVRTQAVRDVVREFVSGA